MLEEYGNAIFTVIYIVFLRILTGFDPLNNNNFRKADNQFGKVPTRCRCG
jgi:hypothetical protein